MRGVLRAVWLTGCLVIGGTIGVDGLEDLREKCIGIGCRSGKKLLLPMFLRGVGCRGGSGAVGVGVRLWGA